MTGRQFSLRFLLSEIALVAVALAIVFRPIGPTQFDYFVAAASTIPACVCLFAAIGGLFMRMWSGALVGLAVGTLLFVPMLLIAIFGTA